LAVAAVVVVRQVVAVAAVVVVRAHRAVMDRAPRLMALPAA